MKTSKTKFPKRQIFRKNQELATVAFRIPKTELKWFKKNNIKLSVACRAALKTFKETYSTK